MSTTRQRGTYKPQFDWTAERVAILQAALPQTGTTTPYRLACSILQEQQWPTTPKNVASKLYGLMRADPRTTKEPSWKDLYRDLWIETHGKRATETAWQADAANRKERLARRVGGVA